MATHKLDEYECEEIYHALLGRKMDLDKRAKDLEEKDGLPEAAAAVRTRIELYMPNGKGKGARPGLIRQFAPQHDIEAEARNAAPERDPNGQQDAFGGGAATGGGHPAGEIVKDVPPIKRPRRKKGVTIEATEHTETVDVAYEIVSEERRLGSGPAVEGATLEALTPAALDALGRAETIAEGLLAGPAWIIDEEFDAEANRVLPLLGAINPNMEIDAAGAQLRGDYRMASDNAHRLAYYVKRITDAVRGTPAPAPAAVLSFAVDGAAVTDTPHEPATEPDGETTGAEVPAIA